MGYILLVRCICHNKLNSLIKTLTIFTRGNIVEVALFQFLQQGSSYIEPAGRRAVHTQKQPVSKSIHRPVDNVSHVTSQASIRSLFSRLTIQMVITWLILQDSVLHITRATSGTYEHNAAEKRNSENNHTNSFNYMSCSYHCPIRRGSTRNS